MKRSWLIGAALVFSLSAVACSDDDDDGTDGVKPDSGVDAGHIDSGVDAGGLDASKPGTDAGDAGDAG